MMAEKVLVSDSDGNNEGTILRPIVQLHWGLVRTSSDMDGVLPRIAKMKYPSMEDHGDLNYTPVGILSTSTIKQPSNKWLKEF